MRENYDARLDFNRLGYGSVSLVPGEKRPQHPRFLERGWTLAEIEEETSYSPDANVGLLTGKTRWPDRTYGVIDYDDKQAGFDFCRRVRIDTSIAETRRGVHIFVSTTSGGFANRIHPGGAPFDLIADRKYVVAPFSKVRQWTYRWIVPLREPHELQPYDAGWLPELREPERVPDQRRAPDHRRDRQLEWARGILHSDFTSFSGCNGDLGIFRAAAFLVQRARLSDDDALALLREWNQSPCVSPPWPDARLIYKVSQARALIK